MKFLASTLLAAAAPPATEHDRFAEAVDLAVWAERLGYDAFGLGQRHSPHFLSSSPAMTLAHIAARTTRIRLVTTVAVLSLRDPVRAAEDYATLDHLSDGRLDLIIGKGNDPASPAVFGAADDELWDRLEESYELIRRLWREDGVSWSGRFRPPLRDASIRPRPYQRPAFEAFRHLPAASVNGLPFDSLEDFIAHGSALVGSPEQVTEQLLRLHERFGNQVFGVGVEGFFLTDLPTARAHLERFFAEVVPVVRAEIPTPDWTPAGRGGELGDQVAFLR
nr:hypothetical protein GCM10020063_040460 [Dactylosporangium thailandense]